MPRTKVVRKNASKQDQDERRDNLRYILECIQKKKAEIIDQIEERKNQMLDAYRTFANGESVSIPLKYKNMTIKEITESVSLQTTASVTCLSKADLMNVTKALKKEKKKLKRSTSFGDDEAGSVNSGGRNSRAKARTTRRMSRSLSRSNMRNISDKTPANKATPPNTYGVVTPKCKPNTPQILLRRPRNGEVALSMQGSPLYTASVVSENMANINIPLEDGRLLTLQPQRGLRISQIPQFDPDTLRQLETLRENLNKVCAASEKRS